MSLHTELLVIVLVLHSILVPKYLPISNRGVNDFTFFCRHKSGKRDNQLSLIRLLVLEYRMVTSAVLLHLSLSRPNFAVPLYKGVNHFAFFVGTRVEKETNQLSLILGL